jgi:hypothetical protein
MRKLTHREVEKRAVMKLIDHFESQIDAVIKQSVAELDKINELKIIQGLHTKKRIDQDCIKNAIKTINSNMHSNLSEKTGGNKKVGEINEKHPQKRQKKQGAEIT